MTRSESGVTIIAPAVVAWPLPMIHFALRYYADLVRESCTGAGYDEVAARFERMQAQLLPDDE